MFKKEIKHVPKFDRLYIHYTVGGGQIGRYIIIRTPSPTRGSRCERCNYRSRAVILGAKSTFRPLCLGGGGVCFLWLPLLFYMLFKNMIYLHF